MVFANNVSYMYIYYHLAIIGKGFLIHIRSHYTCNNWVTICVGQLSSLRENISTQKV